MQAMMKRRRPVGRIMLLACAAAVFGASAGASTASAEAGPCSQTPGRKCWEVEVCVGVGIAKICKREVIAWFPATTN
jgi:hypothetical protein